MKDKDRTKEQLLEELGRLRQKLRKLEDAETKRKQKEQIYKEPEEKYRSIFESFQDVYYQTDREGRITIISPSVYSQAGYDPQEMIGKPVTDFYLDPADRDDFIQEIKKSGAVNDYELKLIAKDGRVIDASASSRIMIGKNGEPQGVEGILRNITERKKMEEELIRLSTAVKMSVDGVIIADLEANIIDVNEAVLKKHGFQHKKEMIGKKCFQFVAPEDREKLLPAIKKMTQKGYIEGIEYQILTKDGHKIPVEANGVILTGKDGQPQGFVATVRDITERKEAEEALRESEEKYREIVELAPDGILTINLKGVITSCNTAFLNLAGVSKSNIIGKNFTKLPRVRPRDIPKYIKMFNTCLKGKVPEPLEIEWHRKDGTTRSGEFHVSLMKKGRKATGIQVIARDITERKEAEEALRESEEKFRNLAEQSPNMIFINKKGRVVYANKKCAEIMGYKRKEFYSPDFDFLTLIAPESRELIRASFKQHQKGQDVPPYEYTLVTKDGQRIEAIITTRLINYGGERAILGIITDITERKRTEQELSVRDWAIKSSISAIALADLEGKLIYVNDSFLQLWGYEDENEVIGKPATKFWRSEEEALKITKALHDKWNWIGELEAIKKDGSTFDAQLSASMVTDAHGNPICMMASFLDITERKRAQEQLKESEELYKDLVEKADIAILIDDKDGNIEYFNEKLLDLFGYSVEEARKMSIQSIVHPGDVDRVMGYHQKRLQGKKVPSRYEFKGIRKDGSIIDLEVDAVELKEEGKITGSRSYIWDISTRKKAERELQESMELFQKTFISQQDAIFLLDANQPPKIMDCNPAAIKIFGYTRLEMLGRSSAFLHVNRTMLKKFQTQLYPAIEKSESFFLPEFKMKRKNGTIFPSEHSVIPLKNEQGKRIGWVSVIRDITERKRAEEVLKESEEKFRNLAEQSPNMIFINKKGRVVYANKKCEEMMGYKREEFYSPDFDFMTLVAPESRRFVRESFAKHKKGKEMLPYEYTLVTKKGQRIEAILTSKLINYEGERAILGIITDITEHKVAEEKYRSLYSAMNEGVCLHEIIYDDKGKAVDYRFTDVNPAYESVTGLKKENVVGNQATRVYRTANPPFLNIFANVAETEEPASIETYFPPLKKYFIISAFSPEKGKFATVYTDITERYNTERELIEAKDQAETALRKLRRAQSQLIQSARLAALGKLSAGIAHEINNPLSIISGHAQILLMDKIADSPEIKEPLETIKKQVDRASSITDQLLQFSKRIKPKFKKSNVNETLKDTLALLKQQLSQDKIKIVEQLSSKPVFIQADSLQLQQVFLNLIVNASHAMPNGGTLTIDTIVKDGKLEIKFTDTGCGILRENLNKLFEPFFTTKESGTGLGLSIAYGIIKAHKGDIKVKSEEGKGTTFTIILPYE